MSTIVGVLDLDLCVFLRLGLLACWGVCVCGGYGVICAGRAVLGDGVAVRKWSIAHKTMILIYTSPIHILLARLAPVYGLHHLQDNHNCGGKVASFLIFVYRFDLMKGRRSVGPAAGE
jgi:hypothetical protein